MPLPFLFGVPRGLADLRRFFFWQAADHTEIQQAILAQKGANIFARVLDPVDLSALDIWIELHQQAHNDANSALGLSGSDLSDFDPAKPEKLKDWTFVHAEEHLA